ncbi:MAG: hypothetical protein QF464_23480 [Myxococcota bacterium]|nr:hypothetical protein [Myxococcota bacterium]
MSEKQGGSGYERGEAARDYKTTTVLCKLFAAVGWCVVLAGVGWSVIVVMGSVVVAGDFPPEMDAVTAMGPWTGGCVCVAGQPTTPGEGRALRSPCAGGRP